MALYNFNQTQADREAFSRPRSGAFGWTNTGTKAPRQRPDSNTAWMTAKVSRPSLSKNPMQASTQNPFESRTLPGGRVISPPSPSGIATAPGGRSFSLTPEESEYFQTSADIASQGGYDPSGNWIINAGSYYGNTGFLGNLPGTNTPYAPAGYSVPAGWDPNKYGSQQAMSIVNGVPQVGFTTVSGKVINPGDTTSDVYKGWQAMMAGLLPVGQRYDPSVLPGLIAANPEVFNKPLPTYNEIFPAGTGDVSQYQPFYPIPNSVTQAGEDQMAMLQKIFA